MKFSDLHACSKCGIVYATLPNNGRCLMIVKTMGVYGDTRCGGEIRSINYKPPVHDERQTDIEDEFKLGQSFVDRATSPDAMPGPDTVP